MFTAFKKFMRLRRRRRLVRAAVKACGYNIYTPNSFDGQCLVGRCHLCEEVTYAIRTTTSETSLAGERFTYWSIPLGFLCARCETVGKSSDCSSNAVRVFDWLNANMKKNS
jgi:hypothetical protein